MDNNKRNFLIQNKVIGVLEIKIDRLEIRAETIQEKLNGIETVLSQKDQNNSQIIKEINDLKTQLAKPVTDRESDLKTELKELNQKLDIIQGIAIIILLGIIIDIFSKPLLTAFTMG
ncbi:hypothetical protein VB715_04095 [Crocosphaera sp. UHCC 0190]|uniref:hypothetical protein n=1 Tax=Crocosphaera sp. UHCC 0190 TaxID=3110246 RepID=UPI002B21631D|nr:hypothetical protein [Crocosphaera sp. UHCC 0190]MEA5508937.1 hypothetical protein [Crocosphaera sp. UHCC 0190]